MELRLIDSDEYWKGPEKYKPMSELARGSDARQACIVMGDENSEDAPVAMVLDLRPGQVINYHAHDCERLEIIVKGSLDVGGNILRPGDMRRTAPREFYGPLVAGPEGCVTLEMFSKASEAHNLMFELENGETRRVDLLTDPSGTWPIDAVKKDEGLEGRVAEALAGSAEVNS